MSSPVGAPLSTIPSSRATTASGVDHQPHSLILVLRNNSRRSIAIVRILFCDVSTERSHDQICLWDPKDERITLPASPTERCRTKPAAIAAQLMRERKGKARAAHPHRMT